MTIMITIMGFIIYIIVMLIAFEVINYNLKKYINERIDESLKLLNKLENINDELDTKIDSVKIKIYNMYLDRCRESLRKKREMDKEIRETAQKIKDKISKK